MIFSSIFRFSSIVAQKKKRDRLNFVTFFLFIIESIVLHNLEKRESSINKTMFNAKISNDNYKNALQQHQHQHQTAFSNEKCKNNEKISCKSAVCRFNANYSLNSNNKILFKPRNNNNNNDYVNQISFHDHVSSLSSSSLLHLNSYCDNYYNNNINYFNHYFFDVYKYFNINSSSSSNNKNNNRTSLSLSNLTNSIDLAYCDKSIEQSLILKHKAALKRKIFLFYDMNPKKEAAKFHVISNLSLSLSLSFTY